MKQKKRFICKECGYNSASWIGKCPECLSWNSFIEEFISQPQKNTFKSIGSNKLENINNITQKDDALIKFKEKEVNSFFGDGLVSGSVILIAGEPGIGKSTFLLFLAGILAEKKKILYFSGEESSSQIKKRYERVKSNDLDLYVSNISEVESIIEQSQKEKADIVFIDSIQTCYSSNTESSAGTVSQIRDATSMLIDFAKTSSISVFIVGHVTKSGEIAGPKIMEHMVDVVIYFEGDEQYSFRVLRINKNRYGSIDDILFFEMNEKGLKFIKNPSGFFLDKSEDNEEYFIGKTRSVILEGKHPLIVEVEALVVPSVYSNPRRFAEGVDLARISRISAIIDKHLNENLNNYDIYFNISGGIKTKDVSIDLAIAAAIYSSKNRKQIKNDTVFIGELSLTGKTRSVIKIEQRIKESKNFGINKAIIPDCAISGSGIVFHKVKNVNEAIKSSM